MGGYNEPPASRLVCVVLIPVTALSLHASGKYVPSISNYIHFQNLENPPVRIKLVGLSVGDGLMDPITQVPGYGELYDTHSLDTPRAMIQNDVCKADCR